MHKHNTKLTKRTAHTHVIGTKPASSAGKPAWRPEPCPLSRDELRLIVAEQLG